MAYVSNELMTKIREEVKRNFPTKDGWKITCKKSSSHSSVTATIRKAPKWFHSEIKLILKDPSTKEIYSNLDRCATTNSNALTACRELLESCVRTEEYYDRSDVMTDYFDVSHYYHISVGDFENPFILE